MKKSFFLFLLLLTPLTHCQDIIEDTDYQASLCPLHSAPCTSLTINQFIAAATHLLGNIACLASNSDNPLPLSETVSSTLVTLVDLTLAAAKEANLSGNAPLSQLLDYLEHCNTQNVFEDTIQKRRCLQCEKDEQFNNFMLGTVANMIGNFANILIDPKNPKVVGPNVAQICASVICIAKESCKKRSVIGEDRLDWLKNLLNK